MIRVGPLLAEARRRKKLTLEEVASKTKIKLSFLDAIEKGDFYALPSPTYAQGFVRNYAAFLGLPSKEVVALFRREFDSEKAVRVLPEGLHKKDIPIRRFRIKQTMFLAFGLLSIILFYLLFQYRYAFLNPPLSVVSPKENATIHGSTVVVSGSTEPESNVIINTVSVALDDNGNFKKQLDVFSGKTTITIQAKNRFGKETTIQRHIEVVGQ